MVDEQEEDGGNWEQVDDKRLDILVSSDTEDIWPKLPALNDDGDIRQL